MSRSSKKFLGTAYFEGFEWALERSYTSIFSMDCDLSHNPADLIVLLEELDKSDTDLVIGSRYINGIRILNWPMKRLLLSYCASIYTRFILKLPVLDVTGGFNGYKRVVIEEFVKAKLSIPNGYSFQVLIKYFAWKKKFNIREVPIIFTERRKGESKMDTSIIKEALFKVILMKWQV